MAQQAHFNKWLIFGVDVFGLSLYDLPMISKILLNDMSHFGVMTDTLTQGNLYIFLLEILINKKCFNNNVLLIYFNFSY